MQKAMRSIVALTLSISLLTDVAFASVDCAGDVTNLSLQLDSVGTVTLSLSGGPSYTYLCAVDGSRNGVSATVCRSMYATLVAAKTAGKKVSIRFNDYSSCSAIPSWADPGVLGWTVLLID